MLLYVTGHERNPQPGNGMSLANPSTWKHLGAFDMSAMQSYRAGKDIEINIKIGQETQAIFLR